MIDGSKEGPAVGEVSVEPRPNPFHYQGARRRPTQAISSLIPDYIFGSTGCSFFSFFLFLLPSVNQLLALASSIFARPRIYRHGFARLPLQRCTTVSLFLPLSNLEPRSARKPPCMYTRQQPRNQTQKPTRYQKHQQRRKLINQAYLLAGAPLTPPVAARVQRDPSPLGPRRAAHVPDAHRLLFNEQGGRGTGKASWSVMRVPFHSVARRGVWRRATRHTSSVGSITPLWMRWYTTSATC